jgi:hypothetical protein
MCLAYYVVRFLPNFSSIVPYILKRCLDCTVIIPLLSIGLSFIDMAAKWREKSPAIATTILCGAAGIALTFCYPMQLAWQADWLECIVKQRYPVQDVAMSAYIYLPASYCFALIMFGATLYLRNIITDVQLGVFTCVIVSTTLLLTVLLQEIHVPGVSAQELYMPCPLPPDESNWRRLLEQATSPRPILGALLNSPLVTTVFDILGARKIEVHDANAIMGGGSELLLRSAYRNSTFATHHESGNLTCI